MDKERVQHMLALGKKKQEGCLSEEELQELTALRQEYLADFRRGFKQQLNHVYIEQEDGSYKQLQQKSTIDPEGEDL